MIELRTLDLFAGAGGFTIAGELAGGYKTVAFCEIDKYAQKVLAKNWPDVPIFGDVTKLKGSDVGSVDVITGGFPCQDLSAAGRGAGIGYGTRSGLFREMLRLACEIREIQGRLPYIIFENVPRFLSGPSENPGEWFGEFLWALAEVGYDAEWFCLSAAAIGAPHKRERVCIVAYATEMQRNVTKYYSENSGTQVSKFRSGFGAAYAAYAKQVGRPKMVLQYITRNGFGPSIKRQTDDAGARFSSGQWNSWTSESEVCGVDDGIPNQSHRLGMMGNAIVPQVFAPVMRELYEAHCESNK
jgi:DNA-cytosine methyltransferase